MLIAKRLLAVVFSSVRVWCASETSTSSGSSETDVNEFSVMPGGVPCAYDVTTVTPVANAPTQSRKSSRHSPEVLIVRRVSPA